MICDTRGVQQVHHRIESEPLNRDTTGSHIRYRCYEASGGATVLYVTLRVHFCTRKSNSMYA